MGMHDLVFDLPKEFLDEHPGGPDVITMLAGKDATADFEDIAHSDSSRTWANKYIIGYVEGSHHSAAEKELPLLATKDTTSGAVSGVWMTVAAIGLVSVGV